MLNIGSEACDDAAQAIAVFAQGWHDDQGECPDDRRKLEEQRYLEGWHLTAGLLSKRNGEDEQRSCHGEAQDARRSKRREYDGENTRW
jgi:hypothetical protein